MCTMFLAFAAIAVIPVVAWYGPNPTGFFTAERTTGADVRLD